MHTALRTIACASAAVALLGGPALAQARDAAVRVGAPSAAFHGGARWAGHGGGYYGSYYRGGRGYGGHGYWGPGWVLGGLGLAVGIAALSNYPYYPEPAYPVYVPVPAQAPPVVVYPPAAPAAKAAPDPIVYPRNGQSAAQTEADRQECNRWATTQPSAMADASVFQRATFACLDGRGYTVR